jgi:hypothetical protein
MKEHLQTEQFLGLDEEQLQVITGGEKLKSWLASYTDFMNSQLRQGKKPVRPADQIQTSMKQNTQEGITFDVSKSWTKPLTQIKA